MDDPRLSELTTVTVVIGDARPGGLRTRMLDVRTTDVPRLDALLDELRAR